MIVFLYTNERNSPLGEEHYLEVLVDTENCFSCNKNHAHLYILDKNIIDKFIILNFNVNSLN